MSAAAKHTPGPWMGKDAAGQWFQDHDWSADSDSESRTMFVPIHANGQVIALVVRTDWNDAQIDADAALISAAPELFEALSDLLDTYKSMFRSAHCQLDADAELIDKARAAIAKVTGEQS